ncbi:uncharacterized protein [Apostichopus japonicus]|uniref:uncharacterized protein n=1 Tax=Stichopus japonicus TaxID=307972 RepID=UPI003AB1A89B
MALRFYETTDHAKLYQAYRPNYENAGIEDAYATYLSKYFQQAPFGTAVDVGCGTGQGTRILTSLFQKVIGIDVSDAMLREAEIATNSTNVEYRNSRAEDMQFLADESVDLINVATAMHWLDAPTFLKEVNRVLRPGGCCAYIYPKSSKCYDLKLDDDVGKEDVSRRICNLFHEFCGECFGEFNQVFSKMNEEYPTHPGYTDVTKYQDALRAVSSAPSSVKIQVILPMGVTLSRKPYHFKSL